MFARFKRRSSASSAKPPEANGSADTSEKHESTIAEEEPATEHDGAHESSVVADAAEDKSPDQTEANGATSEKEASDANSKERNKSPNAEGRSDQQNVTAESNSNDVHGNDDINIKENGISSSSEGANEKNQDDQNGSPSNHDKDKNSSGGDSDSKAKTKENTTTEDPAASEKARDLHEAEAETAAAEQERRGSTWSLWSAPAGIRGSVMDLRDKMRPQISGKMGKVRNKFQQSVNTLWRSRGHMPRVTSAATSGEGVSRRQVAAAQDERSENAQQPELRPLDVGESGGLMQPRVSVQYFQQGNSVSMAYVIHCPKFITSVGDRMGNVIEGSTHSKLSPFQKEKLLHEFFVFFDRDRNGRLTFDDFSLLREHICQLSGWQEGSAKRKQTEALFLHMWHDLRNRADVNQDDVVTAQEWLLMWESIYKDLHAYFKKMKSPASVAPPTKPLPSERINSSSETGGESALAATKQQQEEQPSEKTKPAEKDPWPEWVHSYLEYRFNLYDRTGDGVIDEEEFVYVLTDFGVRERFSRQAWKIFTLGAMEHLTFDYFCQLAEEYYLSNDPAAVGNFITGKLDFVVGEYTNM